MKTFVKILILATLLTAVNCGKVKSKGDKSKAKVSAVPTVTLVPQAMKYSNYPPIHHPRLYQMANVYLNRFPGGVNYNHNVNGYGSNYRVSFQSYPSSKIAYKENRY